MGQIAFITEFRKLATKLNGHIIAGNWARLADALADTGRELTPAEAAAWANLGYLPEEAGQLIYDGVTAEAQALMERHEEELAGGGDELAAERLGRLFADGTLTGVVVDTVPDPLGDGTIIVTREAP